jgi:hypothetical protein
MFDLTADKSFAGSCAQAHCSQRVSAKNLYARARSTGRRRRLWSTLTGRPHRLIELAQIESTCTVRGRSHAGLRTVPLDRIRGSESRSSDFDLKFCPLQDHDRERWLRLAEAWLRGTVLPPVELIKVGGLYFVRDGHHRISVARATGQLDIEAQVTVWRVDGSLPWKTDARAAARSAHARWAPQPAA